MSDRDASGRFAPGNPGGPGRPPRQTETEYLRAVQRACSVEDVTAIAARAVWQARGGDARAREWLSRYLLGMPATLAPKPSDLAWQDESGYDPLAERVRFTTDFAKLTEGWFPAEGGSPQK
jgi:hypothetical protein